MGIFFLFFLNKIEPLSQKKIKFSHSKTFKTCLFYQTLWIQHRIFILFLSYTQRGTETELEKEKTEVTFEMQLHLPQNANVSLKNNFIWKNGANVAKSSGSVDLQNAINVHGNPNNYSLSLATPSLFLFLFVSLTHTHTSICQAVAKQRQSEMLNEKKNKWKTVVPIVVIRNDL